MKPGLVRHVTAIDWIGFEIHTKDRHKFQTVQNALRVAQRLPQGAKLYVLACNDNGVQSETGASDVFRFKIHDPESFSTVNRVIDDLRETFGFASQPRPIAIEVAFDTYQEGATVYQLAQIALDRYRFSNYEPLAKWHLYRERGAKVIDLDRLKYDHQREITKRLADGYQLTDTRDKHGASLRAHAYVKTSDNGGNERLEPEQYRARTERTLQGCRFKVRTMQDLNQFDFASLAPLFEFRRLSDDLHPAARHALTVNSAQQLGRKGAYPRKHPTKIGQFDKTKTAAFRMSTVADTALNREVRDQLRNLTTAWQK